MDWNFFTLLLFVLVLVLCCGTVTNPQIDATRTVGYSNISVNASTVLPSSQGLTWKDGYTLVFICIASAMGSAILVVLVILVYKIRRRKNLQDKLDHMESALTEVAHRRTTVATQRLSKEKMIPSPSKTITMLKRKKGQGKSKTESKRPDLVKKIITTAGDEITIDDITLKVGPGSVAKDTELITLIKDEQISNPSEYRKSSKLRKCFKRAHTSVLPPSSLCSLPETGNKPLSLSSGLSAREIKIKPSSVEFIPKLEVKEGRTKSKTVSKRPRLVKKIITTLGGEIRIDDITLNVGAGCLIKDTEITLIKDDKNFAFKSLHDLGLVDAVPRVVKFFPNGLEFLKPADLTIRVEKTISTFHSELFILHGSYNCDYQRIVWTLVTNDIKNSKAEGVVKVEINGFCFYSFLMTGRGRIARLLCHLNNSFSCCAYALYRRLPAMDTIDISVVFVSKFADEDKKEDIEQLKILYEAGYIKGEKGVFKIIHTDRRLELNLEFPGVSPAPISVKVEKAELDVHGFVVDQFKGIPVNKPASGMVRIKEVHQKAENELLWLLNVREIISENIEGEQAIEQSAEPDPEPPVVYRSTKLTNREISRVSRCVGVDWDSLAGLLDIPYSEREEIRSNDQKYPDSYSKAEQILEHFNGKPDFSRHILEKCVEELEREDLKDELHAVQNEVEDETEELIPESQLPPYENVQLRYTPLSSREMYRLSRRIRVDWDSLAGFMDIAKEERNDIRQNTMYKDHRHRAEKILSLYNRKRDFSRQKLAEYFNGICKDELIRPIMTGQWRNLIMRNS